MKYILLICIPFFFSCNFSFRKKEDRIQALNDMQQTDLDFSRLSAEKGFRKAFLEYMEEDGILLRDNNLPIVGADAVQYISSINDSLIQLSWEPQGGDVAASGDLGYTYGLFSLKANSDSVQQGTYVTIWRKQADGKWKFVLDAGTQGLGTQ